MISQSYYPLRPRPRPRHPPDSDTDADPDTDSSGRVAGDHRCPADDHQHHSVWCPPAADEARREFQGAVDATQARNPNNYFISTRGRDGRFGTRDDGHIRITSAVYDGTANAVLLTSSRRLNLYDHFSLTVKLGPISVDRNGTDTTRIFGGRRSSGGSSVITDSAPRWSRSIHANRFGKDAAPFATLGGLIAARAIVRGSRWPRDMLAGVGSGRTEPSRANGR